MKVLDLDAVRAFVLVADLASFTRAADALGTTQSAVSLKLKRLEAHLGKPLLARTPRVVKLAADGENFLPAARALLDAHDHALGAISAGTHRLSLGVSEHVAVPDLPAVLTSLHRQDPGLSLEMHLGTSTNLLAQYDERRFDAVIVRHEPGEDPLREDGTLLFSEPLAWLAAPDCVRARRATAARGAGRPVRRAGRRCARSTMRGGRGASALRAAAWRRSRPPPPRGSLSARWRGGSRRARWSTSARNSGCRRCRCRRSCCIRGYATHVPAPRCAGLPTALQSRRKLTGFAARNLQKNSDDARRPQAPPRQPADARRRRDLGFGFRRPAPEPRRDRAVPVHGACFLLGALVLVPLLMLNAASRTQLAAIRREPTLLLPGLALGGLLAVSISLQQIGLQYTRIANAGFISSLYVVIVPLMGVFARHRIGPGTWFGALLAAIGLYFLSINEQFSVLYGDWFQLAGAVIIAAHVMAVGHFAKRHNPLVLAFMQFVVCGVACLAVGLVIEPVSGTMLRNALPTLLYGGLLSVGVGYTMQVVAQRDAAPRTRP